MLLSSACGRAWTTICAATVLAALLPGAAPADWREPVGSASPVNTSAARSATNVDLASVGGMPHVVWNEDTSQPGAGRSSTIHVARMRGDGTGWERVADAGLAPISRLSSTSSESPSLADVGGRPWVAWQEGLTQSNSEIRVARLNAAGTAWEETPDALRPVNHLRENPGGLGQYPTLVGDGGDRPYVSFFESDPGSGSLFFGSGQAPAKVYVMRLNAAGTAWEEVGGGHANAIGEYDAAFPRLTLVAGVPYVTYFQVAVVAGAPQIQVRVARLSAGGSWEQVGGIIASGGPDGSVDNPDIATIGGVPHVAFAAKLGGSQNRVRVHRLDGDTWTPLGTAASQTGDARSASLAEVAGQPWVAWRERTGTTKIATARFAAGAWEAVATPYSAAAAGDGADVRFGPALANVDGFPWYAFSESDFQSPGGSGAPPCCTQARVARLEPVFGGSTSQPGEDSATLLSPLESYGLPFPVGFEYGPTTAFGSSSPATVPADPSLHFGVIGPLTPSTLYRFRPYATAGTPLPRVTGASAAFVTAARRAATTTGVPGPAAPAGSDGARPAQTPLVMAILNRGHRVRRGRRVLVSFITTQPGLATLRVSRNGRTVFRRSARVAAGRRSLAWSGLVAGRPARRGRYRVSLQLAADSGARSTDVTVITLVDVPASRPAPGGR